jgi:phospholipid transport system substrate-binding protein
MPRCLPAAYRASSFSLLLAAAGTALGGAAPGPLDTIRQGTEKVLSILRDPTLKAPEKKAERRKAMVDGVDSFFNWPDMAQRSLGIHWPKRTDAEKKEFVALYTELVRDTYLTKADNYSGEQVRYEGEKIEGDYARVSAQIITTRNTEIPIVYSVKKFGDQWLIYDVAIEGVRLVNNYRTQFSSMLDGMSYAEFLRQLQAKVAGLKKE